LHQMTSGVKAKLKPGVGLYELWQAIFPPGSVIGAPKIRAMELISDLETEPRGVYCGAIGFFSPDHTAQFNVAIRSPVIFRDGRGEMGIGSGVVYDSAGEREYDECLLKMKFLTDPPRSFELIETLLYDAGAGFWLLDRHMERLRASAKYFGFAFDENVARTALSKAIAANAGARLRVRLLLKENGSVSVTTADLGPKNSNAVMRYVISPTRLDSRDAFLFHKTTRRELYDGEWAHYHDAVGSDEVVYLNERGELAEGSRTNIFIERDGMLLTPELSGGLLPGVLRAELLETGKAVAAVLTLEDLQTAKQVFFGNSVRGLVKAEPLSNA
jgi:para-aminobenzoate synthetase / 4-amino-4-deoxychorismate lyase